jgi:aminoglycoside phosphotransferase (APT) family kinase protein
VADPAGLDIAALERHLTVERPGLLHGPLRASLVAGGRSNLTYLVTDGISRWVLRRPPLGHVLATAHDMSREHAVLAGLYGSPVPVPRPLLLAGPEVIGAPFYLMEFCEGVVLRDGDDLAALPPGSGAVLADEMIDTLLALHAVRPAEAGLAELGRPAGYLQRQVRRWGQQLAASTVDGQRDLESLGARLGGGVPTTQRDTVVHGDYRLDNLVVDPAGLGVRAVLDWEMATLGDPLTDLASALAWWDGISGLVSPVAAVPGDVPGFPSSDRMRDRYAASSGLDLAALPWYRGFAFFKMGVIFQGIAYRHAEGLTVGEGFDRLGSLVPAMAERGHAALVS